MKEVVKRTVKSIVEWIRKFLVRKLHLRNEDLAYYITIFAGLVLLIVTISTFVALTESLAEEELGPYDEAVTEFVQHFRSSGLTSFFRVATHFGDRFVFIVIIAVLAAFFWFRFKNWRFTLQVVSVLVLSSLSNIAIKRIINRARPALDGHLVEVHTLSYPSGHAMSAMAFYGFLIYLCLRYELPKGMRLMLVTLFITIILLVGLSRVYLGVHYPSDVAAGYLGGLIWVSFAILIFNTLELWRKRRKNNGRAPMQNIA